MCIWKAHFKDVAHDVDIEIKNSEINYKSDPLSFTIDGITFMGQDFMEFQLADESQYEKAKDIFHIIKWGGTFQVNQYCYDLQRFALNVEIPIKVVRKKDNREITGILNVVYQSVKHDSDQSERYYMCDDERVFYDDIVIDFAMNVDGKVFACEEKTSFFQNALNNISGQLRDDYYLKCCFTCQYSDYSPYGDDYFGTMHCYRMQKEKYLKVTSNYDYLDCLGGSDVRQETYLCDEYEMRNKFKGYRGFVNGISSESKSEFTE